MANSDASTSTIWTIRSPVCRHEPWILPHAGLVGDATSGNPNLDLALVIQSFILDLGERVYLTFELRVQFSDQAGYAAR
jgi:hypothetical protein